MNRCKSLIVMLNAALVVTTMCPKAHTSPTAPVQTDQVDDADTTPRSVPEAEDVSRARPRGFHSGLEFGTLGVSAVAQQFSFDNYDLAESGAHAAILHAADLRLTGDGSGYGGVVRAGYESAQGFRFGVGVGATHVEGVFVQHGLLPDGVAIEGVRVSAANFQVTFGKTFNAQLFYPYVDAKVSLNIVVAEIELFTPEYGYMGSSSHLVPSVSVAPRLGAVVPLDGAAFVDLSAEYGLFGAERLGGQLQFGVMLDLR